MNLLTYALLKKEIEKTVTAGVTIDKMDIDNDGILNVTLSTGNEISAGKVPTSDMKAIEQLENSLQELENDTVSITQGGTVEGPLTLLSDPTEEFHAITKSYLEKIVGDLGNLTVVEYIKKKIAEENLVFNADTHFDFPSIGKPDIIYKARNENLTYQWNSKTLAYDIINEVTTRVEDINLIFGGDANGNT